MQLLIEKIPSIKGLSELMYEHVARGKLNKHFLQEAKYKIDVKLLAIAQHYGFKTNIIDCSYDIEVAAFFAPNNVNQEQGVGIIFSNDISYLEKKEWPYDGYSSRVGHLLVRIEGIERIENQRGAFLIDTGLILDSFTYNRPMLTFNHGTPYKTERINENYLFPEHCWLTDVVNQYRSITKPSSGRAKGARR